MCRWTGKYVFTSPEPPTSFRVDLVRAVLCRTRRRQITSPVWRKIEFDGRRDEIDERAVADHGDRQPSADRISEHHVLQRLRARDRLAVGRQQQVAREDAGSCCRAIRHYFYNAQPDLLACALRDRRRKTRSPTLG